MEDLDIGIWLSSLVKLVGGKQENFLAVFSRSWEPNLCKDEVQKSNIFLIRKRYGDFYTNLNAGKKKGDEIQPDQLSRLHRASFVRSEKTRHAEMKSPVRMTVVMAVI